MTHPTDEELDALVKLTEEFVTATWHLLDNSETSGPKDDPTIAVWQPNFDEVSALLDRCEGLPSGSMEHMAAGELLAANMTAAIAALRAQLAAANARADRAEAALAAQIEADAEIADDYTPEKHSGMTLQAHVTGRNIATAIRAQPHNRTALDRLLADAKAKALRMAAKACDWGDIYGDNAVKCILALIPKEGEA